MSDILGSMHQWEPSQEDGPLGEDKLVRDVLHLPDGTFIVFEDGTTAIYGATHVEHQTCHTPMLSCGDPAISVFDVRFCKIGGGHLVCSDCVICHCYECKRKTCAEHAKDRVINGYQVLVDTECYAEWRMWKIQKFIRWVRRRDNGIHRPT